MGVKSLSLLSIYENPSSNRGVCNQQVVGSSPTAGSSSVSTTYAGRKTTKNSHCILPLYTAAKKGPLKIPNLAPMRFDLV
jgi:hypothetical protein